MIFSKALFRPARRLLKRAIYCEPVNLAIRKLLRPWRGVLPTRFLYRIPLVGTIKVRLAGFPPLELSVNGFDDVTGPLYWRGGRGVEEPTLKVFSHLLEQTEVMLDVGAYIGVYALLAGLTSSSRRVFAFEPMPEIAATLRRNVEVNGASNVLVEQLAMAESDGRMTLFIPRAGLPSSSSTREGFREASRRVTVDTVTMDRFVESRKLHRVDLVKIDTETTEPEVLSGARMVMERHRPMIICEVLPAQREAELNAVMDGRGYRYYWIAADGLVEKGSIEADPTGAHNNFLFVPGTKVDSIRPLVR